MKKQNDQLLYIIIKEDILIKKGTKIKLNHMIFFMELLELRLKDFFSYFDIIRKDK